MPDILTIKTPQFELTVWTKDIHKSQVLLAKTHTVRLASQPTSKLQFNPPLKVTQTTTKNNLLSFMQPITQLELQEALFFENKQYEFEFLFGNDVCKTNIPLIIHHLRTIEEAFQYKRGSLRGSVNFGNDIGWFRLGVRFQVAEQEITQYISFEVQPIKMAMSHDLDVINSTIDAYYPLWRFSFVHKTDQELAKSSKSHEQFPLLWLALFQRLRINLEVGIKRICNAPHTRLLPYQHHVRAENIRSRLSTKLEEHVIGHVNNAETQHLYQISRKRLSLDTPENRFIKMVLTRCSQDIARFKKRAEKEDNLCDNGGRVSESFFKELENWKRPLDQLLNRPLFSEVGAFNGQTSESLVLHQRNGYSGVYRIWQELKLYLDLFGRHASISMKSIAELYEVWSLLEIRRILLDLGFNEKNHHRALLNNNGLEKSLKDGIGAAFVLERADGIKIRLAHEPVFRQTNNPSFGKIYSWTTIQKPDIFLEATFPSGESVKWLFDAKYRIADDGKSSDFAPDDAINQMHRYRDALIYINQANDGELEKSRPILGAFILYPGWYDEANTINPYQNAIENVGVGGFPLLPGRDNFWLRNFLQARFGNSNILPYSSPDPDQYFIEESARIGITGMQLSRYSDLTLIAPLESISGLDDNYLQRYKNGTASWFHIRLSNTEKKSITRHVMREINYCAIAIDHDGGLKQFITHLYEVKFVRLIKFCDMDINQAGKTDTTNETEYWLFELGYAHPLEKPVTMLRLETFRFQLTNAAQFLIAENCDSLPIYYKTLSS